VEVRGQGGEVSAAQLQVARRAAATLERLGIRSSAVEAYVAAGRLAFGLGRRAPALVSLGRAQALARHAPVLVRLKGHVAGALAARLGGHDRGVLQRCQAGLTDLARHRAAFASLELRALASGAKVDAGTLAREALIVPVTLRADDLLAEMRRRRVREAIAIDEHGGTAGLVTFEDVQLPFPEEMDAGGLEEIVGPIEWTPLDEGTRQTIELYRARVAA